MTSAEQARHVAEIVKSALERTPEAARDFLDEACAGNAGMRAEVDSLLQFQEQANGFIERGALEIAAEALAQEESLVAEQVIGDYRILSKIGAGGMGDVYLAEDTKLHRKVALKLVRAAMSTDDVVARFRHEEQILASLNDPNIAHLYGGGVTTNGIPFFVMEYVEGLRIDEYCDRNHLSTAARLELFRKVCSALHYAHQHLVIHRDLKPSNILVTGVGEPKLLDFGIAKLLDPENAQSSGETMTLQGVMTPEYASPEQVAGGSITTASDVYSLGVVLYKLLTGQSPYRIKTNRPDEIARAITEQEPTRPSGAVQDRRAADSPFAIHDSRSLRGDLDNIILMALRKEPARRYQSVAQFSEDIRRHLDGLPVVARKDTFAYRATKFVGRNRVEVSAGALVVLAIFAALIVSLGEAKNARRQRDVAQRESAKAERINQFLQRMLSFSNQSITSVSPVAQKKDVTVNAMLDQITPQVEAELAGEPEVRAQILRTIGSAYASQGKYDSAEKTLRAALETQILVNGEESTEVAATSAELGLLCAREVKLDEASRLLEKAVAFYRKQQRQNSPDFSALKLAQSLDSLGLTRFYQGDPKSAVPLLEEALQIASGVKLKEADRAVLASIKADLGGVLVWSVMDLKKGDRLLRESLAEFRQISGPPRWELGATLTLLGSSAMTMNQFEEAEKLLAEGEQIYREALGDQNAYVSFNLEQQATLFLQEEKLKIAEEKARESVRVATISSEDKRLLAMPTWILGNILTKAGRLGEGEEFLRQALAIYEQHGAKASSVGPRLSLSECLFAQDRLPEAEETAFQAYEEAKTTFGKEAPLVKRTVAHLIKVYQAEGKTEAASKLRDDNK